MKKIKRIFIANRGEIARRIAQTAKKMGIESVALTDQDQPPLFLEAEVTDFVWVPLEDTHLYLDGSRILDLALQSGCDALHPGFGFLSESAAFAEQVTRSGIIWIGPSPSSIDAMASKAKARAIAEEHQVPVTPGLRGFSVPETESGDFSELESFAQKTGYPLLLKAALGGGGKGMRLVREPKELKTAALRAYSEGLASFGDGSLICERYLEVSRHIEVQIMADTHGNVVALGDRDCSIQRRHQKILEESPAFQLGDITRRNLHQAAIKLAKSVSYHNAGTVEFLVDWSEASQKLSDQPFYFLEMNTRLQVEHPVTEEVHGLDLVEWQIRVARGEALSKAVLNATPRGHSIEARLYAEDCKANFFPSPGLVKCFLPVQMPGVRWEVGLDSLDEISTRFDPMIAKIIATSDTRENALGLLGEALKETKFVGPSTNQTYLIEILENSPFASSAQATNFISLHHDSLISSIEEKESLPSWPQVALDSLEQIQSAKAEESYLGKPSHDQLVRHAFSKQRHSSSTVTMKWETKHISKRKPGQELIYGALAFFSKSQSVPGDLGFAVHKDKEDLTVAVFSKGNTWIKTRSFGSGNNFAESHQSEQGLTAPVPGKVVKVFTSPGSAVQKNQTLFILESMKMEFEVKASKEGTIKEISVKSGDQVLSGQSLGQWA
jgi:acetyl/propionyl-CoA carboxylase alpha subunit